MADTALRFRLQTVPTIVMVLLTPLFVVLGFWQLDRAEQKRALAASQEFRRKLPALALSGELPPVQQLEYRKLIARGRFLHQKTVLVENRKHRGKTGFHVITPLALSDSGRILLVNRGWIPRQRMAEQSDLPIPQGSQTVEGEARIPQPPAIDLSLQIQPTESMPRWPFLTLEHYAAWSGLDTLPLVLLQSAHDNGEFVREWPRPKANDMMHIGYAVQWFAFALITLIVWLRLSFHKAEASGNAV